MQNEKDLKGLNSHEEDLDKDCNVDVQPVLEEVVIEELAVDGICGIY